MRGRTCFRSNSEYRSKVFPLTLIFAQSFSQRSRNCDTVAFDGSTESPAACSLTRRESSMLASRFDPLKFLYRMRRLRGRAVEMAKEFFEKVSEAEAAVRRAAN